MTDPLQNVTEQPYGTAVKRQTMQQAVPLAKKTPMSTAPRRQVNNANPQATTEMLNQSMNELYPKVPGGFQAMSPEIQNALYMAEFWTKQAEIHGSEEMAALAERASQKVRELSGIGPELVSEKGESNKRSVSETDKSKSK